MRCDVIIKTWYGDLCWLSYCLTFLEKNWQEPDSNIIVLADSNCREVIRSWGFSSRVRYFFVDPWPDGNQFECYLTFLADHFSSADLFAFFDSDTMLFTPMQAADRMVDGKPLICFDPYDLNDLDPRRATPRRMWGPIMYQWLGVQPQADYMQGFPFLYWASSIANVRRLITARTSQGLLESLYSAVPYKGPESFLSHPFRMCEHNVISFYCALYEPDKYEFRNLRKDARPPSATQYHSWTQWSQQTQAQLDYYLAEGYAPEKLPKHRTPQGWTVLASDVRDGHSSLTEQFGRIDVDVGALPTHDFIRPFLKAGSIAIDVGAHIGNFTVPIMRALGKDGLVVSYEPHPTIYDCLRANVAKERSENLQAAPCVPLRYALGPEEREQQLFCNPTNYASNSLLEGVFSREVPMVTVEVRRLDDTLRDLGVADREVSFVKIDVEGAEWNVLRGATELLARHHPVLFFETSENFVAIRDEEAFFEWLREAGYRTFIPFPQVWIEQGHHAHDMLVLP